MICALALDQLGQERAGQRDQAGDVGVDHGFDPLPVGIGQRVGRRREAGIVEQQVDVAPRRLEPGQAFDAVAVAHVDLERQESVAKLLLQAPAAGRRGGRCRSPASRRATNLPRRRLAESRGRAGDQDRLRHVSRSSSCRRASTRSRRRDAKLPRQPRADRARAPRESDQRRKQRRVAGLARAARPSRFRSGRGTAAPDARRRALPQVRRGQARPGHLVVSVAAQPRTAAGR